MQYQTGTGTGTATLAPLANSILQGSTPSSVRTLIENAILQALINSILTSIAAASAASIQTQNDFSQNLCPHTQKKNNHRFEDVTQTEPLVAGVVGSEVKGGRAHDGTSGHHGRSRDVSWQEAMEDRSMRLRELDDKISYWDIRSKKAEETSLAPEVRLDLLSTAG